MLSSIEALLSLLPIKHIIMNKLIIAAGTGFLGQVLINHFRNKFDEIVILTRGKTINKENNK